MWEAPGRLLGRLLGGFREAPGRKAMSKLCVDPFIKSFIKVAFLLPEASGRFLGGRQCQNDVFIFKK